MMNPRRPGVTWSSDIPSRSVGVGSGLGVVARLRSRECTVNTFWWNGCSRMRTERPVAAPVFYTR
jgi:hypothetical protein